MASSAKAFHFDNKPSIPSWSNNNKSGQYSDWFTDKLEKGLFQQYDREDPTAPTEPTEGPADETYSTGTNPLLALFNGKKIVDKELAKEILGNVNSGKKIVDKELAKEILNLNNSSDASAKPIIYSDWSPASRLFGMSQETAFSEHLANTAHQREVADLKAAGLNPVLGVSGSGSTAVSGSLASSGGSSSAEKAAGVPWLDVLGATAALVATASGKPAVGFMISNLINSFEN